MLYSRFKGSEATRYGSLREEAARQQYVSCQQQNGHCNLKMVTTGLVISLDNPWLAASTNDKVHDPSATPPYGLAEYKNPHSAKQLTIPEASQQLKTFALRRQRKTPTNSNERMNTTIRFNASSTAQILSGVILLYTQRGISI